MSAALSKMADDGVPLADPRVLDFMREHGMTVVLDEAQLRRLQTAMMEAMMAGAKAVKELRSAVGSEAVGISGTLVSMLLMGTGYFRSANDTIHALFHARAKVRRGRKKKGAHS